jgi:hypothetical protein
MTDKSRIKIAATITALFLAGISAAGLAARDVEPQRAQASVAAPTAQQTPTAVQAPNAAPATESSTYDDDGYDDDREADDREDDEREDDD